jgi:Flp pilus assembly protein TadG
MFVYGVPVIGKNRDNSGRPFPPASGMCCMIARRQTRLGASLVEFALVALLTILLLIGVVVGGIGIYRYNMVATLAREGSRYASVHGTQYANDTGGTTVSSSSAILSYLQTTFANNNWQSIGLDGTKITCSAAWSSQPAGAVYRMQIVNNQIVSINNTVTVTINYQWTPEAFFGGSINFKSTSVAPMTY